MEYRRMGKTGLYLSVLGYGSWVTFAHQIDEFHCDHLMSFAYENGINFFDNAESYARGESEELMGRVLMSKGWDRSSFVLSSKVYFGKFGKHALPNQKGLGRKHIFDACHDALKRLQTDYLDLFFCHRFDPEVPLEELVRSMNLLIQQGKILYWGTSEWSPEAIQEVVDISHRLGLEPPQMEQPEYNLLHRKNVEQNLKDFYTSKNGLGLTTWSPLASGVLTGKYNDGVPESSRLAVVGLDWVKEKNLTPENIAKVKQLETLAKDLGCTLPALSIAFCIKNPNVTTTILGATKVYQLEENIKALEVLPKLTDEVMNKINDLTL